MCLAKRVNEKSDVEAAEISAVYERVKYEVGVDCVGWERWLEERRKCFQCLNPVLLW